ncbi:hypothetical protein RHMOL_Rhmol07G0034900 [Rhododendron molle]|uniref:Uncharacterized protein n=1 Tax=Rhododendron molle TaxID=49168 RepID=A0ACC0MXN4_RHOML|nr:hypothetical protein RHMOL_Rhmol07G0034900 [Rhododendron molle]
MASEIVVIIGSGPSAIDISREIASVAKQVHLSSRSPNVKVSNFDNTWQHSEIGIFARIELQSKWIARVLSGKAILPSEKEMLVDVEEHYRDMADRGVPKHHTHKVHPHEFEYLDMIADLAGVPPVAERIKEIQKRFLGLVLSSGIDRKRYMDEWDPNDI